MSRKTKKKKNSGGKWLSQKLSKETERVHVQLLNIHLNLERMDDELLACVYNIIQLRKLVPRSCLYGHARGNS